MNLSVQPLQIAIYDSYDKITCEGQAKILNEQIQVLYEQNPIQLLHPDLYSMLLWFIGIELISCAVYIVLKKKCTQAKVDMFLQMMLCIRLLVCVGIVYTIF